MGKTFIRLAGSTTIWLAVLLVGGEIGFRMSQVQQPSHVVEIAPLIQNIKSTIKNKTVTADVLVVGSSLSTCFTYDVEDMSKPDVSEPEVASNCAPDRFMNKQLKSLTGKQREVQVISLPGAMAGDLRSILVSNYAHGKRPKMVVYLAAPRDFVDRGSIPFVASEEEEKRVGASPITSVDTKRSTDRATDRPTDRPTDRATDRSTDRSTDRATDRSPDHSTAPANLAVVAAEHDSQRPTFDFFVKQAKQFLSDHLPPIAATRLDSFYSKPSLSLACDIALDSSIDLFHKRAQLHKAIVDWGCAFFNRDSDLWSAAHKFRQTEKQMTHFDHDLANYNSRYNPPNFDRLKLENEKLKQMASICADHKTTLVVVNMPLTTENKALLDKKLYAQYKTCLEEAAKSGNVVLIDCDATPFSREYFLDSAHLNKRGSRKLQQLLAPTIGANLH